MRRTEKLGSSAATGAVGNCRDRGPCAVPAPSGHYRQYLELVTPKFFTPSSNAPLMPTNVVGVGVPPVESTPTVQHGEREHMYTRGAAIHISSNSSGTRYFD
jgi:hypothetical protein